MYSDYFATTSDGTTATTTGTAVSINLNSLFAPRSGGHQPYGFDTMATLYQRYRVLSCAVEGTVISRNAQTVTVYAFFGFYPSAATFSQTGVALAYSVLPEKPNHSMILLQGGGNRTAVDFKRNLQMHVLEGVTAAQYYAEKDYTAAVGASPTLMPTMQLSTSSNPTTSVSSDWRLNFCFMTEFFERTVLAQS